MLALAEFMFLKHLNSQIYCHDISGFFGQNIMMNLKEASVAKKWQMLNELRNSLNESAYGLKTSVSNVILFGD